MRICYFGKLKLIIFEDNGVDDMVPECGIAASALILVLGHEQPLGAADARIDADVLVPPVRASEGSLGACGLRHIELLGRESALEFLPALTGVLHDPAFERVHVLELARAAPILSQVYVVSHCPILVHCHVVQLLKDRPHILASY